MEAHAEMFGAYQDAFPSLSTVRRWHDQFTQGRRSLNNDPGKGRTCDVKTNENVHAVEAMIMTDRRHHQTHCEYGKDKSNF